MLAIILLKMFNINKSGYFCIYRSYLNMRAYQIQGERYILITRWCKSKTFHRRSRGETAILPLENSHRAEKALEVASSQLQVQWVYTLRRI